MATILPISERVAVAPQTTLLSVEDIKVNNRVTHTAEDALLGAIAKSADAFIQTYTGQALMTQTIRHAFVGWAEQMRIKKGPLQSIASITYVDENGATQVLPTTDYVVENPDDSFVVIRWASDATWPNLDTSSLYPVTINGVYGYSDAASVPADIVQAARWMAGHMYQQREAEVTGSISNQLELGVSSLLLPHVIW